AVRPCHCIAILRQPEEPSHGFNGQAGGNFASIVSAHAVGDDEKPELLVCEPAIFVCSSNVARMFDPVRGYHRRLRMSSRNIAGLSVSSGAKAPPWKSICCGLTALPDDPASACLPQDKCHVQIALLPSANLRCGNLLHTRGDRRGRTIDRDLRI